MENIVNHSLITYNRLNEERKSINPKRFLYLTGPLLIIFGILGLTNLLGKTSAASFFHPPYWINWVHLGLGIVVSSAAVKGWAKIQLGLTRVAAILGLTLGFLGLLLGAYLANRFNIAELADPSDHIAHLTVGLLATWALIGKPSIT